MQIATVQIEETTPASEGKEQARKRGLKGGKARAASMTHERRAEIAKKAAKARWETKLAKISYATPQPRSFCQARARSNFVYSVE
jgi:hypothetical protein